ncbi:MAG TPA: YggS family pyridoxal phosphate-dependent enzyme [Bacteroidales bacterium]|nr:YggS family pyridoxal phosphate-dependent enzyme [Bacteroidales bacterium]
MNDIAANLEFLRSNVPASVRIVAVSKTKSAEDIMAAYNSGQRMFGENRVQELQMKQDKLPGDIQWHMLGHLQTNKVKQIISFVSLIQSVDSLKLLSVINSESDKAGRITDCLLQIRIAREETKYGFLPDELMEIFQTGATVGMNNISIRGVMGMATFTDDSEQVRSEFRNLKSAFSRLKENYFHNDPNFNEISMGMSGDYMIAVEEGSTMVRIGSLIFGERNPIKKQ